MEIITSTILTVASAVLAIGVVFLIYGFIGLFIATATCALQMKFDASEFNSPLITFACAMISAGIGIALYVFAQHFLAS